MKTSLIIPAIVLGAASFVLSSSVMAYSTTTRTTTYHGYDPVGSFFGGVGQAAHGVVRGTGQAVHGVVRGTGQAVRGTVRGTRTFVGGRQYKTTTTTVRHY